MLRPAICLILPALLVCLLTLRAGAQTPFLESNVPYTDRLPVLRKLARAIDFDGLTDPKATLQDALDQLAEQCDLEFDIQDGAFKAEGIDDALAVRVAEKPLPWMRQTEAAVVLRTLLARVPARSGATYLVRPSEVPRGKCVEITTRDFVRAEAVKLRARAVRVATSITPTKFPRADILDVLSGVAEIHAALSERVLSGSDQKTVKPE